MSSSKHQINPNVFVSDIIVNNTSDLQQSIQVSTLEEQKTAEESLKEVEMTNEAPTNAEQDIEMLEALNTFKKKTQSKKDKQNKRLSVEESVSTTEVRPKKRKKQNKPKSVHFPFDEKRLIVICAISNLTKFIQNLSSSQRKAVAEMGFQEILCLQLNSIPCAFAYWLLRNYNPQTDSINDGEREIHLSSSLIQEVFNFPNGGTKVTVKTRPNTNDPVVKEWRSQFGEDLPKKIFVKDLVAYIKDKKDAGRMFKLNILVVFFSLMGETMMSNTVNQRFLTYVKITTDVRNLNWCDYMMACLKSTREAWNRESCTFWSKKTVDEEDEVKVAPVLKKARLSQPKSKQNLKLRLKLPNKKDACNIETDKDEGMVEESENLGENLELNEPEKLVEDVAGDCFVTDSKTDSQEV
ncbi:hypothetical protein R6Q57_018952 [Mikania cordata]